MTDAQVVTKFFDRYSLVARMYPALLLLAPIIWTVVVLIPELAVDYRKWAASILIVGSAFYLLSSLARSRGKYTEDRLLKRWGGWPTTFVLRHRDTTIDPVTKGRYHATLTGMPGVGRLPTVTEEAADPIQADHAYRSATKLLIEARRGKTFRRLDDENASYGFRRNLLGLKWVAVCITLLVTAATALVWWASLGEPVGVSTIMQAVRTDPRFPALLILDLAYMVVLIFMVTRRFVEQAAYEYALALFRTLEKNQS
jgi:hypothetical protein